MADGGRSHRVFLATIPRRSGNRQLVLRILSESKTYITIRVSPLPTDPPIRKRTWHVLRPDLDELLSTKLARPIRTLRCSSCSGIMSIYDGHRKNRPGVFFACSECEELFEI